MDKETINKELVERHDSFVNFLLKLSEPEFSQSKNDKWTAGQQLEHIYLSVKPLRQVLSLPKGMLQIVFGSSNRESKDYEALVKKYTAILENGGRASTRFTPKKVPFEKRQKLKNALAKEVGSLCSKIDKFSEKDLETYVLPHPLLGKLTIREMLYFTMYHVDHHYAITNRNLNV